jgi:hypothetical protein
VCLPTYADIYKIQILKSLAVGNDVVYGHCFKNISHFIFEKFYVLFSRILETENLIQCSALLALLDEAWYLFQSDTSCVQETCHGNRLPELP